MRQLFAERHQQQGPGYLHHQQQKRQRRRSLTGRDRSRPLRKLSGTDDDPLCKTVCFTAPSQAGGTADMIGINGANSDVRGELLALFGRLPNLGGQLWSESFRGNNKMKTAQSAPELKWLLDDSSGGRGSGPGPMAGPGKGGGSLEPMAGPGKGGGGPGPKAGPGKGGGGPGPPAAVAKAAKKAAATEDDNESDGDDDQLEQVTMAIT